MNLKPNPLIQIFKEKKIIKSESLIVFHKGTRNEKHINVLVDLETGALILDKCVECAESYYQNNTNYALGEQKTLVDTACSTRQTTILVQVWQECNSIGTHSQSTSNKCTQTHV